MIRFALDIHLIDNSGNNTTNFVTIYGDCMYDIFKNISFDTEDVGYARIWYLTQSVAELEAHGEGWWNFVAQWYLTPDELEKLKKEALYARN